MALSAWYATLYPGEQCPVPQARTVDEAARLIDEIRAHYKADPWGGTLDYTEDPRRIEWYRRQGRLAWFPGGMDCDDVAYVARATLMTLIPTAAVWILLDSGPAGLSHAICCFEADGMHWSLDTNGLRVHQSADPRAVFGALYPAAQYTDAYPVTEYQFPDPRSI